MPCNCICLLRALEKFTCFTSNLLFFVCRDVFVYYISTIMFVINCLARSTCRLWPALSLYRAARNGMMCVRKIHRFKVFHCRSSLVIFASRQCSWNSIFPLFCFSCLKSTTLTVEQKHLFRINIQCFLTFYFVKKSIRKIGQY